MVPALDPALDTVLSDTEVRVLARLEYERWMTQKIASRADTPDGDDAVPLAWGELPDAARVPHLQAARRVPGMVARAGFQVLRGTSEPPASDAGPRARNSDRVPLRFPSRPHIT